MQNVSYIVKRACHDRKDLMTPEYQASHDSYDFEKNWCTLSSLENPGVIPKTQFYTLGLYLCPHLCPTDLITACVWRKICKMMGKTYARRPCCCENFIKYRW